MRLLKTMSGDACLPKPVWAMRQAGRYLPEYKRLRANYADFLDFCFDPKAALTATLQPIERFGFDAAIIFSDILVIPECLGQKVNFSEGVGPVLASVPDLRKILNEKMAPKIAAVYEAITLTRQKLDREKALIGFAGAPWTLMTYMLGRERSENFTEVVAKASAIPDFTDWLGELGVRVSEHCLNQIRAGANAIQLFDSWGNMAPKDKLGEWIFSQARAIVERIRGAYPDFPIIYFAKGLAREAISELGDLGVTFSVDENADLKEFSDPKICLQGNLSPAKLAEGTFERDLAEILDFARDRPFIVNLGHGVLPHTPIGNVARFVELARSYGKR